MFGSFSKTIHGKKITIKPYSYKDFPEQGWSVKHPCPWCKNNQISNGYKTAKKAADGWFDDLDYHYKARHK